MKPAGLSLRPRETLMQAFILFVAGGPLPFVGFVVLLALVLHEARRDFR